MRKLNLSASGGSDEDYSPIPEGRRNFEVDDTRFFTASTGTEMLEVRLSCVDEGNQNRKVWRNFPLTEKAAVFINNLLKAVGSKLADSESLDVDRVPEEIMGKKLSGYVTTRKLNTGKLVNDIEKLKPVQQSSIPRRQTAPVDDGDIYS